MLLTSETVNMKSLVLSRSRHIFFRKVYLHIAVEHYAQAFLLIDNNVAKQVVIGIALKLKRAIRNGYAIRTKCPFAKYTTPFISTTLS